MKLLTRRALPLLVVVALLAGCEVRIELPQLPGPPTPVAAPATSGAAPTAAPAPGNYPALPAGLARAEVTRVIDGDTIAISLRGRDERVRLIGINTPETVDPRRPVECYGAEASANAKALLEGQSVLLEDDTTQDSRDSNGRLLRYVWLEDGRMANLEQVAQGYAAEYTYAAPYKYRAVFREAERSARNAGLGLWSAQTCGGQFTPLGEGPAPAATQAATPAAPGATASCPRAPSTPTAPEAPVRIVGLDKAAEVVELSNAGFEPINLDGWVLCSLRGGESQGGLGGTLAPGETRAFANPGGQIWSNSNRDDAALYDPSGSLVSYWADE